MPEVDPVLERGGVEHEFRDILGRLDVRRYADRRGPLPTTGTAITEFGIRAKERADLPERAQQTAREVLQRWAGRP